MRLSSSLTNRIFLACTLLATVSLGFAFAFVNAQVTGEVEAELRRDLSEAGTLVDQRRALFTDTFTTMALLIGFLPTLFAAYSTREELVSTLDDLTGDRVTPLGMLDAYTRDGDARELDSQFERWEEWTASVLESHSSYPMLMMFRSKQSGQSWIAAMVIVTETAALCISIIDEPPDARALRLCRRTAQTVVRLRGALIEEGVTVETEPLGLPEERLQAIYDKFGELGFPRRPFGEARERLDRWHEAYVPELEALIRRLLIPREFRLPPAVTGFSND